MAKVFKYLSIGVLGDENEREDPFGRLYRTLVAPALDERGRDIEEGTGK